MIEQINRIYVSVGYPTSNFAMQNKVMVDVDLKNGQTIVQAAKLFRKQIAEEVGNKPSALWFEIYRLPDAAIPMYQNWLRMEML